MSHEKSNAFVLREVALELGRQAAAADAYRAVLEDLVRLPLTKRRVQELKARAIAALRDNPHPHSQEVAP